jgi:hypothetical protein
MLANIIPFRLNYSERGNLYKHRPLVPLTANERPLSTRTRPWPGGSYGSAWELANPATDELIVCLSTPASDMC